MVRFVPARGGSAKLQQNSPGGPLLPEAEIARIRQGDLAQLTLEARLLDRAALVQILAT